MSLTLVAAPGFTEIPDANFNAGNPLSDSDLKNLNAAAKFAAVRGEQFWGFYKHGETVAVPTSPADGYVYSRSELIYVASFFNTGSYGGALAGTQVAPVPGATSQPGTVLQFGCFVDPGTGVVSCAVAYFNGSTQHNTTDGIVVVTTIALRQR